MQAARRKALDIWIEAAERNPIDRAAMVHSKNHTDAVLDAAYSGLPSPARGGRGRAGQARLLSH